MLYIIPTKHQQHHISSPEPSTSTSKSSALLNNNKIILIQIPFIPFLSSSSTKRQSDPQRNYRNFSSPPPSQSVPLLLQFFLGSIWVKVIFSFFCCFCFLLVINFLIRLYFFHKSERNEGFSISVVKLILEFLINGAAHSQRGKENGKHAHGEHQGTEKMDANERKRDKTVH